MGQELAPLERSRLSELEAVVERGMQTFVEVGHALMEIREQRLYRETHGTFAAYCRERFGFSDSRGRQLIAAARTVTTVTAQGLPAPQTEREARQVAREMRGGAGLSPAAVGHLQAAAGYIGDADDAYASARDLATDAAAMAREAGGDEGEKIEAEALALIARLDSFADGYFDPTSPAEAVDRAVRRALRRAGHPWDRVSQGDRDSIAGLVETLADEIEKGLFL